jgi:hypothetical protein
MEMKAAVEEEATATVKAMAAAAAKATARATMRALPLGTVMPEKLVVQAGPT